MDPSNPLSPADLAAVESVYQKITTPLLCRLHLHHWCPWKSMVSMQYASVLASTWKQSPINQVNVQLRMCSRCGKPQARAVPAEKIDALPEGGWTLDEDGDE